MKRCPICQSSVSRSRTRGWLEKLIVRFSSRHPYRCQQCFWRGWMSKGQTVPDAESPSVVILAPESSRDKKRRFWSFHR